MNVADYNYVVAPPQGLIIKATDLLSLPWPIGDRERTMAPSRHPIAKQSGDIYF